MPGGKGRARSPTRTGRAGTLVALALTVAGCAAGPAERPGSEEPAEPGAPVVSPGAPPGSADDTTAAEGAAPEGEPTPSARPPRSAVVALVRRADDRLAGGEPERAAAALERALRIDPQDAGLWHRLARVRLSQGRAGQAAQLAARSNALAGEDVRLQIANWRLIAQARADQGDREAAQRARAVAERLGAQRTGGGDDE